MVGLANSAAAQGDAQKGVRAFHNQCMPCHAILPDRHMTGPSLSGIVGRKVGSVAGFERYSAAIRQNQAIWSEDTLLAFIANPQSVVPGTSMAAVVPDDTVRRDIVAYLLATQTPGVAPPDGLPKPHQKTLDLKTAGPATTVASITYCRDTYAVGLANGTTLLFWEPNVRFKTDGSSLGPPTANPIMVPTGMHGDRAYIVFANPRQISDFVRAECPKS
jgi:cytochrome c